MEVIAGRYRLDAILGSGGMGEVWAAWDQVDGRKVAVKLFTGAREDDVLRARFFREAERTRSIHHPNVVHCSDAGEVSDGRLYLVMEFIEGESLAQLLKREGALAMERAVRLAQQLCSGLQAVHDAGLVHRDVKPANVMFVTEPGAEPRLKLIDFGIAQGMEDETRLTRTGMLVGTAAFCSPEQVLGQPLDGRSDQYAVGVLLYRMFTGVLPYASDGTANVLFSHVQKSVPPFRVRAPGCAVLPTVETVVLRALAKDPAERYPSMRALGDALVAALPEVEGDLMQTQPSTAAVSRGVAAVAPVAKRAPNETTRQWAAVFRYALSKEDGATLLEAWEAAKGGLAAMLSVNELVAVGRAAAGVSRFELARDCFAAAAEARGPAEEVAGARVMLARLLDERLGQRADARKWMERVVADSPGSAAGRYAAEWLTRVGSA